MSLSQEIDCPDEIWSKFTFNFVYIEQNFDVYAYLRMILSAIGSLLNLAILAVFYAKNLNSRFEKCLRTYSLASFIILVISFMAKIVDFNLYTTAGFYSRLVLHSAYYVAIAFSRMLETYIIYERIQLYKPGLKFLSKTSLTKLSIQFLVLAILANSSDIALLLNRYALDIVKDCNSTEKFESFLFLEDDFFRFFSYFMLYLNFLVCLIVDISLNLYLLNIMKTLHMKISDTSEIKDRRTERNNAIIAIVLCLISTVFTIVSFFRNFFTINKDLQISELNISSDFVFKLIDFFFIFKFSINFFLFYFLNKKFRESVNRKGNLLSSFLCHKKYMV